MAWVNSAVKACVGDEAFWRTMSQQDVLNREFCHFGCTTFWQGFCFSETDKVVRRGIAPTTINLFPGIDTEKGPSKSVLICWNGPEGGLIGCSNPAGLIGSVLLC